MHDSKKKVDVPGFSNRMLKVALGLRDHSRSSQVGHPETGCVYHSQGICEGRGWRQEAGRSHGPRTTEKPKTWVGHEGEQCRG